MTKLIKYQLEDGQSPSYIIEGGYFGNSEGFLLGFTSNATPIEPVASSKEELTMWLSHVVPSIHDRLIQGDLPFNDERAAEYLWDKLKKYDA